MTAPKAEHRVASLQITDKNETTITTSNSVYKKVCAFEFVRQKKLL